MSSKSALSLVACGLAAAMMVSILASPAHADCVLDWSFNGNTNDSINGYNGTFYGGTATYGAGPLGVGQCINLTTRRVCLQLFHHDEQPPAGRNLPVDREHLARPAFWQYWRRLLYLDGRVRFQCRKLRLLQRWVMAS